jgi:hypothetical protein
VENLIKNLVKSFEHCKGSKEEVNLLLALIILVNYNPADTLDHFYTYFKDLSGFSSKDSVVQHALVGLLFCTLLPPVVEVESIPEKTCSLLRDFMKTFLPQLEPILESSNLLGLTVGMYAGMFACERAENTDLEQQLPYFLDLNRCSELTEVFLTNVNLQVTY